jgi:two-component system, NarL family, response regulator NreC
MNTRVLLAEDHTLVRSGIRSLLETSTDVDVVGEAGDGRLAIDLALRLKPDLVLMDVAMAGMNGIDATRQLAAAQPKVRVLMLSAHSDEQYIFEALRAGAKGYVLKSAAVKELMNAIREVLAGRTFVSPSLAGVVVKDYVRRAQGDDPGSAIDKLTPREREVLQLIAEGRSSTEVAKLLTISARTVDTHRQNIMTKLSIRSVARLTRFAIRHGLCSP